MSNELKSISSGLAWAEQELAKARCVPSIVAIVEELDRRWTDLGFCETYMAPEDWVTLTHLIAQHKARCDATAASNPTPRFSTTD